MANGAADTGAGTADIVPAKDPLVITITPRTLRMVQVEEGELEELASPAGALHLAFFGIAVGALVSFGITVVTVMLSDRSHAAFVALTFASGLASVFFGCAAARAHWRRSSRIKALKGT